MSLDALLEAIERRGREDAERVLDAARAEAEAIARADEARLDQQREASLREIEARLRSDAAAELSAARRQARARVLRSREELLERVFEAAGRDLPAAAVSERFRRRMPALLAEAFRCVDAGGAAVECAPELREAVAQVLGASRHGGEESPVTVRPSPDAITGVRVLSADGRVLVDGTLATGLARLRPRLAIVALGALGPGPVAAGTRPQPEEGR